MSEDDAPKKQDGKAIYAALTAFKDMPERQQPQEQERDWTHFDLVAEELTQAERRTLIKRAAGSLAREDGRDMTQELLDERRVEAEDKDW